MKQFLLGLIVISVATLSTIKATNATNDCDVTVLSLSNVEMLAQGEPMTTFFCCQYVYRCNCCIYCDELNSVCPDFACEPRSIYDPTDW